MTPGRRLLAVGVLAAGLAVGAWVLASGRQPPHVSPSLPASAASPARSPAARAGPVRLRIPVIGVDAPVDEVGLTPQGDLATPADPGHVGWYRGGSRPGEPGSSVVDGHLDWWSGPAVFADLGHLHAGDPLSVTFSDGHAAAFRISTMATYSADQRPPAQLFRADGPPQLVLITCAGRWDGTRYLDRLVVTARPEGAPRGLSP